MLKDLFGFLVKSKSAHSIDSPTVLGLYTHLHGAHSLDREHVRRIEAYRRKCHQDISPLSEESKGLPSRSHVGSKTVATVVASAVSGRHKCELLYKIAEHFKSKDILELGTSLGISTAYLALPDSVDSVVSIEQSEKLSKMATSFLHEIDPSIKLMNMSFKEGLRLLEEDDTSYDLIYIDGDHSYAASLEHLNSCKGLLKDTGVVIMDDIYWSEQMKKAWITAKADSSFNMAIDMFYFGLLTKIPKLREPVHMRVNPFWFKWKLGVWR